MDKESWVDVISRILDMEGAGIITFHDYVSEPSDDGGGTKRQSPLTPVETVARSRRSPPALSKACGFPQALISLYADSPLLTPRFDGHRDSYASWRDA